MVSAITAVAFPIPDRGIRKPEHGDRGNRIEKINYAQSGFG